MSRANCSWRKEGKGNWLTARMKPGTKVVRFCYIMANPHNRKNKLELTCFEGKDGAIVDTMVKNATLNQENVQAFRELGCAVVSGEIKRPTKKK